MSNQTVCHSFLLFSLTVPMVAQIPEPHHAEKLHSPIAVARHHRVITPGSVDTKNTTPGVAIAPNGDWLVAYNKTLPNGQSYHTLRRSLDRGLHWEPEVLQWNASTPDPTLWTTPQHRLFIEFGKVNNASVTGAAWSVSFDSGYTWGDFSWFDSPANATLFVTNYLNVGKDIYGAGYQPSLSGDGTTDTNLWLSEDDATSWRKVSTLRQSGDAPINETAISRMGRTGMFAISRSADENHTYVHVSRNMGRSWSPQLDYVSQVGVLDNPQLLKLGDVLILIGRDTGASQLVAYLSQNEGRTFGSRLVLDTYEGGFDSIAYSAMIRLRRNTALLVYSTRHHGLTEIDCTELHIKGDR